MHFAQLRGRVESVAGAGAGAGVEGVGLSGIARQILGRSGRIVGEQIAEHFQGELLEQIRLQARGQSAVAGTTLLVAQLVVLVAVVLVAVRTVADAIAGQLLGDAQNGLIAARSGRDMLLWTCLCHPQAGLPNLQTLVLGLGVLALLPLAQHCDHQLGLERVLAMLPDDAHTAVEQTHWILHLGGGVLQQAGIHAPLRSVRIQ